MWEQNASESSPHGMHSQGAGQLLLSTAHALRSSTRRLRAFYSTPHTCSLPWQCDTAVKSAQLHAVHTPCAAIVETVTACIAGCKLSANAQVVALTDGTLGGELLANSTLLVKGSTNFLGSATCSATVHNAHRSAQQLALARLLASCPCSRHAASWFSTIPRISCRASSIGTNA